VLFVVVIAILAVKLIAETVNGVLSKFTVGLLWFGSRRTLSVCKKLVFYSHSFIHYNYLCTSVYRWWYKIVCIIIGHQL